MQDAQNKSERKFRSLYVRVMYSLSVADPNFPIFAEMQLWGSHR